MNGTYLVQPAQRAEAGALAGLIAGMVMGLVAMFHALSSGMSFWLPMQQIAGVVYGVEAVLGGVGPTVVGIIIHLALSACFGLLFGLIVARLPMRGTLWLGLAYGVAIWLVASFAILPAINPTMQDRVAIMPGWWFGLHMIFGAVLSLASPFGRNFAERATPPPATPDAQAA